MLKGFLSALAFLTTIPVRTESLTGDDFARASVWFSWVGVVMGALLVLMDRGIQWVLPPLVANVVLVGLWIVLSGGLHWDGFLDCCDALVASVSPTRRLEILKDVHIGTYAFVGGGLLFLLYVTGLSALPFEQRGIVLLVAPIVGRWMMTAAQQAFPYARSDGMGQLVPPGRFTMMGGIVPVGLALPGGGTIVVVVGVSILIGFLVARWMARQLGGGLTGDCYGALCEITQVIVVVGMVVMGHVGMV